jgi:hypothetical protein
MTYVAIAEKVRALHRMRAYKWPATLTGATLYVIVVQEHTDVESRQLLRWPRGSPTPTVIERDTIVPM